MLATVSARVPVEVRNQVHQKLRSNGLTPSQFINDVYVKYLDDDSFLETTKKKKNRQFDNETIIETIKASTCNYGNPLLATFDYKDELSRGKKTDYEVLYANSLRELRSEKEER